MFAGWSGQNNILLIYLKLKHVVIWDGEQISPMAYNSTNCNAMRCHTIWLPYCQNSYILSLRDQTICSDLLFTICESLGYANPLNAITVVRVWGANCTYQWLLGAFINCLLVTNKAHWGICVTGAILVKVMLCSLCDATLLHQSAICCYQFDPDQHIQ